jgi:hypothetical protein
MELKNINPKGDDVVLSNLINVNFCFLKIVEIEIKKQTSSVLFLKRCHDGPKSKFFILFTSQINIKWTKALHVDINLFTRKINYQVFGSFFGVLVTTWMIGHWSHQGTQKACFHLKIVSVSNGSILQIISILTSPNLVFYTYIVSNKKVSS